MTYKLKLKIPDKKENTDKEFLMNNPHLKEKLAYNIVEGG